MASRTNISHKDHAHPATPGARAVCRRHMEKHGEPWDGVTKANGGRKGAGAKAAETRRANEAARVQAEAVDKVLDATERDAEGRFARLSMDQWLALFGDLQGAQEYLIQNAELKYAKIGVRIAGVDLVAEFDGENWAVGQSK